MGLECDHLEKKGEREKRENQWLEGKEMVRDMEEELVWMRRVSCFFFSFPVLFLSFLASPPFVQCPPFVIYSHNPGYQLLTNASHIPLSRELGIEG